MSIELLNMDCMEYMKGCKDKQFDLAIADPPYGIGAENHAGNSENGWTQWNKKNWDSTIPDLEYFIELKRVSKNQIIWGGNYFGLEPTQCFLIWDKKQRDFSLADCEMAWTSFSRAAKVFDYPRAKALQEGKIHPTQKPVALYKWLLTKYAKAGDKILDTHLGSGSIAIACHDYGFDLVGTEIDVDYYNAMLKRFTAHKSQTKLFTEKIAS